MKQSFLTKSMNNIELMQSQEILHTDRHYHHPITWYMMIMLKKLLQENLRVKRLLRNWKVIKSIASWNQLPNREVSFCHFFKCCWDHWMPKKETVSKKLECKERTLNCVHNRHKCAHYFGSPVCISIRFYANNKFVSTFLSLH